MVTGVEEETLVVLMVNFGETLVPAATVTLAGTEAIAGLELDKEMTAPCVGAGPSICT